MEHLCLQQTAKNGIPISLHVPPSHRAKIPTPTRFPACSAMCVKMPKCISLSTTLWKRKSKRRPQRIAAHRPGACGILENKSNRKEEGKKTHTHNTAFHIRSRSRSPSRCLSGWVGMLIINSTGRLIESDFINKYLSIEWCPPDEILIELSLSPGTNYPPKRSPETTASYPARWLCVCVPLSIYIWVCVFLCDSCWECGLSDDRFYYATHLFFGLIGLATIGHWSVRIKRFLRSRVASGKASCCQKGDVGEGRAIRDTGL